MLSMGDDYYNPYTAQTHVKPVPLWHLLLAEAAAVAAMLGGGWLLIVALFSLERIS